MSAFTPVLLQHLMHIFSESYYYVYVFSVLGLEVWLQLEIYGTMWMYHEYCRIGLWLILGSHYFYLLEGTIDTIYKLCKKEDEGKQEEESKKAMLRSASSLSHSQTSMKSLTSKFRESALTNRSLLRGGSSWASTSSKRKGLESSAPQPSFKPANVFKASAQITSPIHEEK